MSVRCSRWIASGRGRAATGCAGRERRSARGTARPRARPRRTGRRRAAARRRSRGGRRRAGARRGSSSATVAAHERAPAGRGLRGRRARTRRARRDRARTRTTRSCSGVRRARRLGADGDALGDRERQREPVVVVGVLADQVDASGGERARCAQAARAIASRSSAADSSGSVSEMNVPAPCSEPARYLSFSAVRSGG